jgi:hypothetical protein
MIILEHDHFGTQMPKHQNLRHILYTILNLRHILEHKIQNPGTCNLKSYFTWIFPRHSTCNHTQSFVDFF